MNTWSVFQGADAVAQTRLDALNDAPRPDDTDGLSDARRAGVYRADDPAIQRWWDAHPMTVKWALARGDYAVTQWYQAWHTYDGWTRGEDPRAYWIYMGELEQEARARAWFPLRPKRLREEYQLWRTKIPAVEQRVAERGGIQGHYAARQRAFQTSAAAVGTAAVIATTAGVGAPWTLATGAGGALAREASKRIASGATPTPTTTTATTMNEDLRRQITRTVLALVEIESGGDPYAISPSGKHYGVLQIGDATAQDAGLPGARQLLGDVRGSLQVFARAAQRSAHLHRWHPVLVAVRWKGGAGTLSKLLGALESGETFDSALASSAPSSWSLPEYVRRFVAAYQRTA